MERNSTLWLKLQFIAWNRRDKTIDSLNEVIFDFFPKWFYFLQQPEMKKKNSKKKVSANAKVFKFLLWGLKITTNILPGFRQSSLSERMVLCSQIKKVSFIYRSNKGSIYRGY